MRTILIISKSARILAATALLAVGLAACGSAKGSIVEASKIKVVAAENFWGSIASQLGGDLVQSVSIITKPDADPHDYEPTPQDSSTIAQAQLMIVNGLGYDTWATKALDANPASNRQVINVGDVTGFKQGDNPHRWYSPNDVRTVIDTVTDKLKALAPSESSYFDAQKADFLNDKLGQYNSVQSDIAHNFANTPIGATESIVRPLASALGLNLITPAGFTDAISEGRAPTAGDKATADKQISNGEIKVLLYNAQNSTPDVQALVDHAKQKKIPVVAVTETLTPETATFQDWQSQQLEDLSRALAESSSK